MRDDPLPESSGITNEQVNIQGSSKTYNVFEVLSNGRRTLILYLGDPIERGQSVKLQFLQLQRFDNSRVSNVGGDKTLQNLIQERLRNLPVPLLLQSLKFLKTIETLGSSSLNPEPPVSRRRIHWVAVKIYENLRNTSPELAAKHMSDELIPVDDIKFKESTADSIVHGEVENASRFGSQSLAIQPSLPFFFGFVWPLLKAEGWKLRPDTLLPNVQYLPPVKFGTRNQVSLTPTSP